MRVQMSQESVFIQTYIHTHIHTYMLTIMRVQMSQESVKRDVHCYEAFEKLIDNHMLTAEQERGTLAFCGKFFLSVCLSVWSLVHAQIS
jgi:hypothetical protein